jgi:VCBS repeat-containing protein
MDAVYWFPLPDLETVFVAKPRAKISMHLENGRRMRVLLLGLVLFAGIFTTQSESPGAQLRLSWSDNSDDEEGFEVQRMSPGIGFHAIAIVGANATGFSDLNLAAGVTYCYRIRAFHAEAISAFSNLGCATTPTTISVSKFGSGAGSVISQPPGISCGSDCAEPYQSGTIVTLVPIPAEGSVFTGWSGVGCAGTGDCIFNLDTDRSITAVFDMASPENFSPPTEPPPAPPAPGPAPLVLTGLTANLVSPQFVGTPIAFTATTAGGVAPLQFKWWLFDGSVWRVAKDWDPSNSFVFDPTTQGSYVIGVWARNGNQNSDRPDNDAVLTRAFSAMPRSCPAEQYLAEFFANRNLSGDPVFTSCDLSISYSWFWGETPDGISGDNFSVRWTGRIAFDADFYRFNASADDGIRVWIDGNLVIDGWLDQAATNYQAILELPQGEHIVQVDYYQNGGDALTQLYWQRIVASNDDFYVMFQRENLTVDAPGVLGNDNQLSSSISMMATLVSGTAHGSLVLNPDGSFSYTPDPQFNGTDSFTYRADSGAVTSNLATVTITVTAVNDIPVASNDSFLVIEDNSLLANDNDLDGGPLTAVLLSTTANGTLNFNLDGSFNYSPNANFNGTDTFTYIANDGMNDSNVAMVTLVVTVLNDVPVAQNDNYETTADSLLSVVAPGVLDNDLDPEGDPLAAILVTAPLFGSVTLNADGSFEYIPPANFSGTDSFSYKTTDGGADSNVAMVTINVIPPAVP